MKVLVSVFLLLSLFLAEFDMVGVNGIIPLIQANFQLNDAQSATIQTASSIAHSIALTLVWILGDSFERRKLFLVTLTSWIALSLLAILLGSDSFVIFVVCRSLAAAASSIFIVLVQVILADIFQDRALGIAIMCMSVCAMFSGAVSGIVSSWIVSNEFSWQSGLLIGPIISIAPLTSLVFMRKSFRITGLSDKTIGIGRIISNAFGIFSNKTYILTVTGATFTIILVNAYMFWFPSMILNAWNASTEAYLGLSYTTIITLWSSTFMITTIIGLPPLIWFAQSWYHGTGLFTGRKEYGRAYPIFLAFGSTISGAVFTLGIILTMKSFIACLIALSIFGLSSSVQSTLGQQVLLMAVPNSSRAAAVALMKLFSTLISTPSAQIVGMISDAIRGDSTLPFDRFRSYQLGLILFSPFLVATAVCNIALIFVFSGDCDRAQEKDKNEQVDERTSLIGAAKGRSESILDTIVKSRATTLNSVHLG